VTRTVVGLDGCPAGWVAVELRDGRVGDVRVVGHVDEVTARTPRPAIVGVDTPIGLDDAPHRAADVAARRVLGRRASSVFSAPLRSIVDGYRTGELTTHAAASARSVVLTGRGMSIQAWRIVPKVAEADAAVAAGASLREVHPEVAFTVLAGQALARKTSWRGLEQRRQLLAGCGIDLPADFPGADRCAPDDVVDAAVCAYVADGLAVDDGTVVTLPSTDVVGATARGVVIAARRPRRGTPDVT
jgi:predicted RNase H-like nuclease